MRDQKTIWSEFKIPPGGTTEDLQRDVADLRSRVAVDVDAFTRSAIRTLHDDMEEGINEGYRVLHESSVGDDNKLMFGKANGRVFALDKIVSVDFSEIQDLHVVLTLSNSDTVDINGIEALELAMQIKPSILEGKRMKYAKCAWFIHNVFGHPLMQILAMFGLYKLAFLVHDKTVPKPKAKNGL